MKFRIFALFCSVVFFISCEKNINFPIENVADKLVVDASIENDKAPVVFLTKSLNYFATFSPSTLTGSFVHDAEITISNGTKTHKLKEYALNLAPGVNLFYYSIDSASLATAFVGEVGKSYTMNIISEGKTYNAQSTIPPFYATLDSMWTRKVPSFKDTTARILNIRATDPPGRGNYVRYFTSVNGEPFFPGEFSVFDDQVIDGTTFTTELDRGFDKNFKPASDSNYFHKGDTIAVKFCNIDRGVYQFWSTWEFALSGVGNPFSQPNKVIGNISNNALGVFAGYSCRTFTIIAQ